MTSFPVYIYKDEHLKISLRKIPTEGISLVGPGPISGQLALKLTTNHLRIIQKSKQLLYNYYYCHRKSIGFLILFSLSSAISLFFRIYFRVI